jgi:hypothetical protein
MKSNNPTGSFLSFSEFYSKCLYNAESGKFYKIIKEDPLEFSELIVNDSFLMLYLDKKQRVNKKKANVVAWEILNQRELPKDHFVVHKDLDEGNFTGNNLILLNKKDYRELKQAIKNTFENGIRYSLHKTEAYSYVVQYYKDNTKRSKYVHDIIEAKKQVRLLLLENYKILSKYCISKS